MPSTKQLTTVLKKIPGYLLIAAAVAAAVFESQALLELIPEKLMTPSFQSVSIMSVMVSAISGLFWGTVLLIVFRIGRGMYEARIRSGRSAMFIGAFVYSLFTAPFVLIYLLSWNLLQQTGRFAGWEVVQFSVRNKYMLWQYLTDAEAANRELLIRCGILVGVVLPLIYLFSALVASVANRQRVKDNLTRVWCGCAIAILAGLILVLQGQSPTLRSMQLGHLSSASNPVVSLAASAWESYSLAPIEPVLTAEDLVQQDVEWSAPSFGPTPPVIVVAIESLRHDVVHLTHQGQEVTPNLNRLAKAGIEWKRAYAQSTHSDYADVCIVSSLYPLRTRMHHFYGPRDPWPKTRIYDLLKPAGYSTAIISSQNEAWGGMEAFLDSENLDLFYHPERSDEVDLQVHSKKDPGFNQELEAGALVAGKFPDFHTTDKAIEWVREQATAGSPFFLSLNFQSSHFPYLVPDSAARPFVPHELGDEVSFMSYPQEKTAAVRNAYYNGIHECDRQLGRLIDALDEMQLLDEAILLVVGENGEAFHENGSVGHAREPVEPALHVATVIHAPQFVKPRVEEYPLEHVDLMPTVLGMMEWPAHPNFQGVNVLAEDRMAARERLMFFHVLSPAAQADAVLFGGRWKYVSNRQLNTNNLFDIEKDPGERTDIMDDQPKLASYLHTTLKEWRERQLAYYHYPDYFTTSFPPKAPRWHPVKKAAVAGDANDDANES